MKQEQRRGRGKAENRKGLSREEEGAKQRKQERLTDIITVGFSVRPKVPSACTLRMPLAVSSITSWIPYMAI